MKLFGILLGTSVLASALPAHAEKTYTENGKTYKVVRSDKAKSLRGTREARYGKENYIGINGRVTSDEKIGVIGKVKVADVGQRGSISIRPNVLFGDDETEGRVAATYDRKIGRRGNVTPYLGGGVSINNRGSGEVDPMVSAGVDVNLSKDIVATAGTNVIFQKDRDGGTDAELNVGIGYRF